MTESAAFSSAARKDCFNELDVEMFEFVAALDHHTCDLCGEMDGKVFKMSEYQVGVTAEPLHPCCRCTTASYFEDMAGLGERYARDIETGETYKVPSNMTYKQWRALQGQKPLVKSAKSGIIKSLDIDDLNVMASAHELLPEVTKVIGDTISEYEKKGGMFISDVHFGDFYDEATGKPALLQVTVSPYGMTELNVNSRFLGGKSLKEINLAISTTEANLPVDLREAVIHECGHAKAYYRKSASDIYAMNSELCNQGVPGISDIAAFDGAECIAEVEVLLSRGDSVPDEAMDLYNKFVKGVQK